MQDCVCSVNGEEPNGTTFHLVGRRTCTKRLRVFPHIHKNKNNLWLSVPLKDKTGNVENQSEAEIGFIVGKITLVVEKLLKPKGQW